MTIHLPDGRTAIDLDVFDGQGDLPRRIDHGLCAQRSLFRNLLVTPFFEMFFHPRICEWRVNGDEIAVVGKMDVRDQLDTDAGRQIRRLDRRTRTDQAWDAVRPRLELTFEPSDGFNDITNGLSV